MTNTQSTCYLNGCNAQAVSVLAFERLELFGFYCLAHGREQHAAFRSMLHVGLTLTEYAS